MAIDHKAAQDFEYALIKAFWRRAMAWLTGKSNELLPFDEVRAALPLQGQRSLGLKQVKIDHIIGSLGRYRDFDRAFLPTQTRTRERWVNIDKAHLTQVNLPAVELYKMGEVYFVKDGNHRVSVARERGQIYIDAHVIEIDIPVPLTAETRMDDLAIKQAYAAFLSQTGLDDLHPASSLEGRFTEQYDELREHIAFHRWVLGEKRGQGIAWQEAAISWYENVYQPLAEALREQGLLESFKGATELDLYLWAVKYQWYLRLAYKAEPSGAEAEGPDQVEAELTATAKETAARQVSEAAAQEGSQRLARRLVSTLQKAGWLDELMVRQEEADFQERTQLATKRPEAKITFSIPGQFDRLMEHIAVHRWYLGEKARAAVSLPDAAESWYDQVYMPLTALMREQGVLERFPGRTEADLYLYLMSRRGYLDEEEGGDKD